MLDIGWTELVVIAIVLIVVVGPKDLPPMLRAFGKMMTKFRGVASDFRQQFDEALKEADLDDVRKTLSEAQKLNPAHSLREAMNPLRQMGNDIKADLQKASAAPAKPAPIVEPVSEVAAEATAPAPMVNTDPVKKPKRVSKAKVEAVAAPVVPVVVKTTKGSKVATKKTAAVVAAVEKPKARKVAVKTKSKGDA